MIIWKDDMPYIVREMEDLKYIVSEDIFESLKEFIEDYVDNSEEVERLNDEIESLEDELSGCEDECGELEEALEELRDKYSNSKQVIEILKDFIDVMDDAKMTKDQWYYWDRLKDAVYSL
ncbi:MAG: hypothetical protein E7K67_12195 [Peptostreptococcaceae bacterium]|jgi:predicted nuclease with TOPRIM domain|uniref:hypothetical protein n=1 Tax=Zhenhengia sp. TaxID=2944208 RepID=UPI002068A4ED|nr:hypothetical protein [Peptostreptococcaceae bacterium]DAV39076.1 MAG TPA: A-type inclusion protein repeat protein [Caudoviricetes sp.]